METIAVSTRTREELVDITSRVEDAVRNSGVRRGMCMVFVPHTTAGVTVNENADPSVVKDIVSFLGRLVPVSAGFSHLEGNSDAHVKASLVGVSELLPVEDGRLVLGTWQGIFFAEFDGPRPRKVYVTVTGEK